MNILVTGADGFVGKNLIAELKNVLGGGNGGGVGGGVGGVGEAAVGAKNAAFLASDATIFEYDVRSDPAKLDDYCRDADFVFHLAGVNRPKDPAEFATGNIEFAKTTLETLKKRADRCPVLFSSSTQAALDNPYGRSKKASEELFFRYAEETGANVFVYRLPNLFGKWQRPNYNGVVATFCSNVAADLPIRIDDRNAVLTFAYIDDVVREFVAALEGNANRDPNDARFCAVPVVETTTLGALADLIRSFRETRKSRGVPDFGDAFVRKLYATYTSCLPPNAFSYPLDPRRDARGSFAEFLRSPNGGQISVNVSKPGVVKGEHWHQTKCEKFLVVSGKGVVRFRKIDEETVYEYFVSGDRPEVVDVPVGYTHHFENLGETDLVTLVWCDECFDPNRPDSHFLPVRSNDGKTRIGDGSEKTNGR